ncbi:hypothetical protein [Cohnella sp. 56]
MNKQAPVPVLATVQELVFVPSMARPTMLRNFFMPRLRLWEPAHDGSHE